MVTVTLPRAKGNTGERGPKGDKGETGPKGGRNADCAGHLAGRLQLHRVAGWRGTSHGRGWDQRHGHGLPGSEDAGSVGRGRRASARNGGCRGCQRRRGVSRLTRLTLEP